MAYPLDPLTISQLTVLSVMPNDIVVVNVPEYIAPVVRVAMHEQLTERFPDVRWLVVNGEITFSVLRQEAAPNG